MNLLLDTHALIWFFERDPQLSKNAKNLIEDPANQNFFSVASIWEMIIKQGIGKLELSKPVVEITRHIQRNGIEILGISSDHALKVGELEMHHKDPFDRLIIAQSICLNFTLISKDEIFDRYPGKRFW